MLMRIPVVGFSGPDGSGKSTLSTSLRALLERGGLRASVVYVYGCPVCRRVPVHELTPTAKVSRRLRSGFPARMHAILDAAELIVKLGAACGRVRLWSLARRRSSSPSAVIVTDRS